MKIVEGTDSTQLAKGAGHFTDTSIWDGNVCVAGLTFYHPADAMKLLAVCYEKGFGVERNLHEAFRWYGRAAASGDPESAEKVASCYESGISVESDSQKAAIFRD